MNPLPKSTPGGNNGGLPQQKLSNGLQGVMDDTEVESLAVGIAAPRTIAVRRLAGATPGLFWLGGYRSDMTGSKAEAGSRWAAEHGAAFTRFDYSGHGASGGDFEEGTISRWLEEALAVFDTTAGPQILIGSSMGGWLALLLAEAHRAAHPDGSRIAGILLIAPAVDMTRALMWEGMTKAQRRQLEAEGVLRGESRYANAPPLVITRKLIDDGDRHLFGDRLIETGCPVHILQGVLDKDVPWKHTVALVSRLASDDVVLTLVKDGDHRLSRPEDIDKMLAAIASLREEATATAAQV